MRTTRRAALSRALLLLGVAVQLTAPGCSPTPRGLSVEVRDAVTGAPARQVIVFADVPSRDHPFSIATLLGETGPWQWRARTDERGVAKLKYLPDRPVRVGMLDSKWSSGVVLTNVESPQADKPQWRRSDEPAGMVGAIPEFLLVPEQD